MITPVKNVHKLRSWVASLTNPQSVTIDSCVSNSFKLIMSFSMQRIDLLFLIDVIIENRAFPYSAHSCTLTVFSFYYLPINQASDRPTSKVLKSRPYRTKESSWQLFWFPSKPVTIEVPTSYRQSALLVSAMKVNRFNDFTERRRWPREDTAAGPRSTYCKSSSNRPNRFSIVLKMFVRHASWLNSNFLSQLWLRPQSQMRTLLRVWEKRSDSISFKWTHCSAVNLFSTSSNLLNKRRY